jgi:hypothetical protein
MDHNYSFDVLLKPNQDPPMGGKTTHGNKESESHNKYKTNTLKPSLENASPKKQPAKIPRVQFCTSVVRKYFKPANLY